MPDAFSPSGVLRRLYLADCLLGAEDGLRSVNLNRLSHAVTGAAALAIAVFSFATSVRALGWFLTVMAAMESAVAIYWHRRRADWHASIAEWRRLLDEEGDPDA